VRPRTPAEVEVEIVRLGQLSTRRRAVDQLAQAMRWVVGTGEQPMSERLLKTPARGLCIVSNESKGDE
jgi:hypothetical protein